MTLRPCSLGEEEEEEFIQNHTRAWRDSWEEESNLFTVKRYVQHCVEMCLRHDLSHFLNKLLPPSDHMTLLLRHQATSWRPGVLAGQHSVLGTEEEEEEESILINLGGTCKDGRQRGRKGAW